jgi:hypothetical protein
MNKRGARRARQKKSPRRDTIVLIGRQALATVTVPTSGLGTMQSFLLNPTVLGDRPAGISVFYTRFRIKNLKFMYKSLAASTQQGLVTMGVTEDADATSTLTSRDQILNLRRSTENTAWKDMSLNWSPVDRNKWYYVNYALLGADNTRFDTPGTFYVVGSGNGAAAAFSGGFVDVQYTIELTGATLIAV